MFTIIEIGGWVCGVSMHWSFNFENFLNNFLKREKQRYLTQKCRQDPAKFSFLLQGSNRAFLVQPMAPRASLLQISEPLLERRKQIGFYLETNTEIQESVKLNHFLFFSKDYRNGATEAAERAQDMRLVRKSHVGKHVFTKLDFFLSFPPQLFKWLLKL